MNDDIDMNTNMNILTYVIVFTQLEWRLSVMLLTVIESVTLNRMGFICRRLSDTLQVNKSIKKVF